VSAAIERNAAPEPYGDYPMPWCLECVPSDAPADQGAQRRVHGEVRRDRHATWQRDDEVGMLERWLLEFTDAGSGTSSPPPMS